MKAIAITIAAIVSLAATPGIADTYATNSGSYTAIAGGNGTGLLSGGFGGNVSMSDPLGGGSTSALSAFTNGALNTSAYGEIAASAVGKSWSYQTNLNNQYQTEGGGENTTQTRATLGGSGTADITAGSGSSFYSWTPPIAAPAQ